MCQWLTLPRSTQTITWREEVAATGPRTLLHVSWWRRRKTHNQPCWRLVFVIKIQPWSLRNLLNGWEKKKNSTISGRSLTARCSCSLHSPISLAVNTWIRVKPDVAHVHTHDKVHILPEHNICVWRSKNTHSVKQQKDNVGLDSGYSCSILTRMRMP